MRVIMGIDPGLARCGYGIIEQDEKSARHLTHGVITTTPQEEFTSRLAHIHDELILLFDLFHPEYLATEQLFFCKNLKTAVSIGQVQGVILLTAVQHHLPVQFFTPLQVKQTVTSYGKADKNQVQEMVKILLKLEQKPVSDDAADALALALCCTQWRQSFTH